MVFWIQAFLINVAESEHWQFYEPRNLVTFYFYWVIYTDTDPYGNQDNQMETECKSGQPNGNRIPPLRSVSSKETRIPFVFLQNH